MASTAAVVSRASDPLRRPNSGQRGDDPAKPRRQDGSAAVIQARVRGARARAKVNSLRENNRRETAAVRIEAAVRGRLERKRAVVPTAAPVGNASRKQDAPVTVATFLGPTGGTTGEDDIKVDASRWTTDNNYGNLTCRQEGGRGGGGERGAAEVAPEKQSEAAAAAAAVAHINTLGIEGVRTFFDSLGLGACADRLRRRSPLLHEDDERKRRDNGSGNHARHGQGSDAAGIDGIELARIMQAEDAGEELLAVGVSARLHRIKIMNALDIRNLSKEATLAASQEAQQNTAYAESAGESMILRSGTAGERVTATAAVFLARRLLREQEAMSNALRKLRYRVENSDGCRTKEDEAGQGAAESRGVVQERTRSCFAAWNDSADKANEGLRGWDDKVGRGVREATCSVPLSVLVELEEAVLGQTNLADQVQNFGI